MMYFQGGYTPTTVSVLGMYTYNPRLFDGVSLPEGMDKNVLVSQLTAQLAELELLYNDPDIIQQLITAWAAASLPNWKKLWQAMTDDYDPLHNYDRTEEWEESGNGTSSQQGSNVGFDHPGELALATGTEIAAKNANQRKGRAYGNIGVTTSADMIRGEMSIRNQTVYDMIINDFKARFCLGVY